MFLPKSQNAQHVRTCIIQIWIQEVKYILKMAKYSLHTPKPRVSGILPDYNITGN